MPAVYVETREIPLDRLAGYPGNARRGDVATIQASLKANGQYRSLVVRETGDGLIVLAGNHTLEALAAEGRASARCEVIRCDDAEAARINLVDNRAADLGDYDQRALADLLAAVSRDDAELFGTGYGAYDVEDIFAELTRDSEAAYKDARVAEVAAGKAFTPRKRQKPIDLILTVGCNPMMTKMAVSSGWGHGGIAARMVGSAIARLQRSFPETPPPMFADCEWHDYDHAQHIAALAELQPKYATVRDILTRSQAEQAGVEWYPLEQILEWADEAAQHAENVIVIPKYDCMDKIPEKHMLGYSVWTSYGGTELPLEAFKGRRVHLLGGSWDKQRAYLNVLGDDVVSLDNNHILNIARFGNFSAPDGPDRAIADVFGSPTVAGFYPAVCLSLCAISSYVAEQLGIAMDEPERDDDPHFAEAR